MAVKFERHPDTGEVVNPPVLSEYEQRINDAAAAGDEDRLALVYEDYANARKDIVKRLEKRGKDDEVTAVVEPPSDPTPTQPTGGDKK